MPVTSQFNKLFGHHVNVIERKRSFRMAGKLHLLPPGKIFIDRTAERIDLQLKSLYVMTERFTLRRRLFPCSAPEQQSHFIELGFKLKKRLLKIKDNFRSHNAGV